MVSWDCSESSVFSRSFMGLASFALGLRIPEAFSGFGIMQVGKDVVQRVAGKVGWVRIVRCEAPSTGSGQDGG